MSNPIPHTVQARVVPSFVLKGLLASAALFAATGALGQEEVPIVISPLRVESDPNGVNLVSGKTEVPLPVLSVPAAPNLRFDRVQNAAPYFSGRQSGSGGEYVQASFSVHTKDGMSESFNCPDFDCTSLTGTGSWFVPGANLYNKGGTGETYTFDRLSFQITTGNTVTKKYYASSIGYPNGEIITYTYDTGVLASQPQLTYYRPSKVASSLGFYITIAYHSSTLGDTGWGAPAVAAIYNASAPATPLGRLTYSADGTTITDLGGRVYTCTGCANVLGVDIETHAGSLTYPGEASAAVQVAPHPSHAVVGSVTRDGVPWNYSYTNLRYDAMTSGYWFDRVTVTGPNGYSMVYDLTVSGRRNVMTDITDSLARETEVEFDGAYRSTRMVYPEGNEVTVTYDLLGNVTLKTTKPKPASGLAQITETAGYPTSGCAPPVDDIKCFRPLWYRDALGRQTDFAYNAKGQLTQRTDPADAEGVRRRTYVTYATSVGLSRPSVTRMCGLGTTCGTADEIRTEYSYWAKTFLPSSVRRIDQARGVTLETLYSYDLAGRELSEDGPLPGTADAKFNRYDIHGRRTWEISAADANGVRRAKKITYRDADDKVTLVEEGTLPNESSAALTVYHSTVHSYDDRRNPRLETLSAGGTTFTVTQRTYDDRGQLTCETRRMNPDDFAALPPSACTPGTEGEFGPDRITRHVYDSAGQLTQVQRAYGTPIQQDYARYTYSLNGQRQTIKDANDNLTTLEYDGFDRLTKMRFPVATKGANQSSTTDYEQYGYDAVGNRTTLRKRDNKTITYGYDGLNRVSSKTVPTSTDGAPGYSVHYGYDMLGLQSFARFSSTSGAGVSNDFDAFGWLRTSTTNLDGVTRTVTSEYDVHGNRTRITHPGGVYFDYQYDAADQLETLTENGSSTLAMIEHDEFRRRRRIDRDSGGAATTFTPDPVSRPLSMLHDLDGNGTSNDLAIGYAYNPASQIAARSQTNSAYEHAVAVSNRSYAVNGRNQYTQITGDNPATLTWDDNGNLRSDGSTTFTYDTENRLVSATGAKNATLTYDPLGRLYQVTSGGSTTRFLYDGDRLIAEYNTADAVQNRYVHGAGVDEPLVWYQGGTVSSATRRYLHGNHQGSIIASTNAAGAKQGISTYDAYGLTTAPSTWRFQYTGQAAIPQLGLYYYKARFYNPALGRFMQTDPIGYDDDNNLYAYVGNDPLNKTDPTGKCGLPCAGLGIAVYVIAQEVTGAPITTHGMLIAGALGAIGGPIAGSFGKTAQIGTEVAMARTGLDLAAGQVAKTGTTMAVAGTLAAAGKIADNITGSLSETGEGPTHPLAGADTAFVVGAATAPIDEIAGVNAPAASAASKAGAQARSTSASVAAEVAGARQEASCPKSGSDSKGGCN